MFNNCWHGRRVLSTLCGAMLLLAALPATASDENTIKDLHYGETLFHFYQGKYFSAISDLLVAKQKHPIKTQGNDPEILLGGLYLSYDMSHNAGNIFKKLIKQESDKTIQDTAWYYLARLAYHRGNYPAAKQYIDKVDENLPYRYNDESQHLNANINLKLKNYPAAIKTLSNFSGDTEWLHYAKYNLAIAMAKTGEKEETISLLREVASIKPDTVEQTALRDKANLALGYTALRSKKAASASSYFKNIRLLGSQSNKALLGIGWAHHNNGDYHNSLVPWLELQKRLTTDPSVQEAMLTVPYTLEKIDAKEQALAYYNHAINTYNAEIVNIKNVTNAVSTGEFIAALRNLHSHQSKENHLHYTTLPDSVATPYLHQIIAGDTFQAALKNYRDLLYMQNTLRHWENQMPAYKLMLKERKLAYQQKLGKARQSLRQAEKQKLGLQHKVLKKKLTQITKQHDVLALATEKEQELFDIIAAAKKRLTHISRRQDMDEQANRLRIYYGLVYWQVSTDFAPRRWLVQKGLNETEKLLAQQQQRKKSLQSAFTATPGKFKSYANAIKSKQQRLKQLRQRLGNEIAQQEKYIVGMAITALRKQQNKLENYHIRASYSLTRLYDSLAIVEKKP